MGLLSPSLAWFALAGAIPIIIHLLNRQKYRRVRWAAMEFLLRALQKTRRRLQLENLLLLLIRVALLVLLALAAARPFLSHALLPAARGETHLVLLVDTSCSMGYKQAQKTPLARAKEIGASLIGGLKNPEGDRITIVTFNEQPARLLEVGAFYADRARVALVEDVALTDFATDLPRALAFTAGLVAKSPVASRRVFVLSDLQRTGWPVDDAARDRVHQALVELGKAAEVTFVQCGGPDPWNRTVEALGTRTPVALARRPVTFEVRVRNHGAQATAAGLTLKVDKGSPQTERAALEPRSAADVPFTVEFAEPGPHLVSVEAEADFLGADDVRHLAVDVLESIRVLVVDGEPGPGGRSFEGESDFLRLALNPVPEGEGRPGVFALTVESPVTFDERRLGRYDVVVLANVDTLSEEKAKALEAWTAAGGGLWIACGDQVDRQTWNELMHRKGRGLLPARLGEAAGDKARAPENALKLIEVDYRHPALEFFRDRLQAALGSLIVYEYLKVEADPDDASVRVLARYDEPGLSPALLERRFGRGRVLLWTTSLDSEWNLMPGRPPYLVLVNELAKYLGSRPGTFVNVNVGDPFQMLLRIDQYAKVFNFVTPRQEYLQLFPSQIRDDHFVLSYPSVIEEKPAPGAAAPDEAVARERGTTAAGVYELLRPGGDGESERRIAYLAANVRPEEGDLDPVTEDDLRRRFPNFKFQMVTEPGGSSDAATAGAPPSSPLWRYALWAVLGLLVAESVLAWKFGSRQ
jgi:hypothetical protein